LVRQVRRSSAGPQDAGDLGLDLVAGLAGVAAGEPRRQLGELPAGLGQGLVEPAGLLVMQVLGVGDHDAALRTQHHLAGLEGLKPGEAAGIDDPVAAVGHREQVGVIRRRRRRPRDACPAMRPRR
jgi:hypothetical protein